MVCLRVPGAEKNQIDDVYKVVSSSDFMEESVEFYYRVTFKTVFKVGLMLQWGKALPSG